MQVEVIPNRPDGIRFLEPRCQAIHTQHHTNEELVRHPNRKFCKHGAVVKVDGKPLCRIHAGFELLKYAVEHGELSLPERSEQSKPTRDFIRV